MLTLFIMSEKISHTSLALSDTEHSTKVVSLKDRANFWPSVYDTDLKPRGDERESTRESASE